jgi:hypothetical protein
MIQGGSGVYTAGSAGAVDNYGTVVGTFGDAVLLPAGGAVANNSAAALLTGRITGVYLGRAGSLTNSGTINGQGGDGVVLIAGGNLANAYGLIAGVYGGVYAKTSVTTLANNGMIAGPVGVMVGGGAGSGNSVSNNGTISGSGGAVALGSGDGVILFTGGTLTNNAGGAITGHDSALYLGRFSSVSNTGTINGKGGDGVILIAGGNVANSGAGLITGLYAGIYAQTGVTAVTNDGTVASSVGILVGARGSASSIVNSGTVSGSGGAVAPGSGDGVVLFTGGAVTNNAGAAITGRDSGVYLGRAGSLTNSGTINGQAGDGVILPIGGNITNAAGLVTGRYVGVYASAGATAIANGGTIASSVGILVGARGSVVTVVNSGMISGSGAPGEVGSGIGIQLLPVASVINNSSGSISGQGNGLVFGAAGTLANAGTITAVEGNAVVLFAGGSVANSGLIDGKATAGIYLRGGTISNTGTITGRIGINASQPTTIATAGTIVGVGGVAILGIGGSSGRLTVDPGAVFQGVVRGSGSVLELASGAAAGALSGLGTSFVNFGTLTIDAGAVWKLSGSAPSTSNNGTILVAGTPFTLGALSTGPGNSGLLRVSSAGTAEFGGAVDAGQTISFDNNSGTTGTLLLDAPLQFAATIARFQGTGSSAAQSDAIDLVNTPATSLSYSGASAAAAGSLTVFNGSTTVARLAFAANASRGAFNLIPDGHGGTYIVDPPPSYTPFALGQTASAAYAFGLAAPAWFQRGG